MSTLIAEADSRCDERCYNAESSGCTCVCGGDNHGVGLKAAKAHVTGQQCLFDDHEFMSLQEFYSIKKRSWSRAVDFGFEWRDGSVLPTYRVTWVENTGELYARDQRQDRIEILGHLETLEKAEQALKGWGQVCGRINSLAWIRMRV